MKIALLISGRAARYEVCLLPILQNAKHDIDLFMSINDEDCEYYEEMRIKLQKWLKGLYIKPFQCPKIEKFYCIQPVSTYYIDGKWIPYKSLSMFYNDMNAMNMAIDYSKNNNIQYDYYMKFRSDIIYTNIPDILPTPTKELKLYSIKHIMMFTTGGIFKVPCISDNWAWGNEETMKIYCNTYNFILDTLKKLDGDYGLHPESNLTDNIYSNNIPVEYVNISYNLDNHRTLFDISTSSDDNGNIINHRIPNSHEHIDIKTVKDTSYIPITPYKND